MSRLEGLAEPGGICVAARVQEDAAGGLDLAFDDPGFPPTYRVLAACCAHMGRPDEARATVARPRAITPLVVPGYLPYRNAEDRELFWSGLRLAVGETVT
jgi:hypothetical protein